MKNSAKEIKTKCGFHNVLCMDRTMTIVAGFSATGIPICEEWSVDPATNRSFEYRNVRYADWLCSNIRVDIPFTAEHLFVKGAEPYQITEEINRKNARDLMRVERRLVTTYPLAVKKAQEGKIPSVAQKKIGSGAWTPAFPQGETKDQDDDDRKNDDRKRKRLDLVRPTIMGVVRDDLISAVRGRNGRNARWESEDS